MSRHSSSTLAAPPTIPVAADVCVRKGSRLSLLGGWAQLAAMAVLVLAIIGILFQPAPKYYLATGVVNGKVQAQRLPVGNSPVLSDARVGSWSAKVVSDVYAFDFTNAFSHLASVKHYFTSAEWSQFSAAVQQTNLFTEVKDKQLITTVTLLQDPIIAAAPYKYGGDKVWPRIDVPIMINFIGATGSAPIQPLYLVVHMSLVSAPGLNNPEALQVASFVPGPDPDQ